MHFLKNNKDILKNFTPLSTNFERLTLLLNYSIDAIKDPSNGDAVSAVGDLSNMNSLQFIKDKMLSDKIGRQILEEKPRIREDQFDFDKLKSYSENTLGKNYYNFMSKYNFKPDERPICKYYTDLESAYILQRYREIHDFIHVLLGYDIDVIDELAVKIYESLHLKLPSAAIASLFGSIGLLSIGEMTKLFSIYIPHVKINSENNFFIMNISFENCLEKDINEMRKDLRIISLEEFKQRI
jgi:ubiquinone biosynthesis protein COQ4